MSSEIIAKYEAAIDCVKAGELDKATTYLDELDETLDSPVLLLIHKTIRSQLTTPKVSLVQLEQNLLMARNEYALRHFGV
jgi:hypothetical protein